MASGPVYRVVVRRNMVTEIRPVDPAAEPDAVPAEDALAISTRLADNNQANGCLDGDYDLASFEDARQFAGLCLGFQKNLCEKALEAIAEAGADGSDHWCNRFVPGTNRD